MLHSYFDWWQKLTFIAAFTSVSPRMGNHGWPFANVDAFPAAGVDPVNHAEHVKDLYLKVNPDYDGRCVSCLLSSSIPPSSLPIFTDVTSASFTVPVLWDKKLNTIVNNESSEIIRIFNTAFNDLVDPEKAQLDIHPESLRKEIDEINEWVYDGVNSEYMRANLVS
jgi:putative glutathione S-transferase